MNDRVLVLDGHTTQALACVRSLARAGCTILVASDRRRPLGAWSRYCRAVFRLSGESLDAFAELRAWARERGATVVLPLTERSCVLCDLARDEWQGLGITVACAPGHMLRLAFDKARTVEIAERCGVRTPRSIVPGSPAEATAAAASVGFPCVVKPRFSNAWDGSRFLPDRGTRYAASPDALDAAIEATKQGNCWPLIQSFEDGTGKGVFALCDRGRIVAWFAHERLRDVRPSGSGSSLRRSIALEAHLREPAERLLRAMEWHGPAMVEFRDDGVRPPCLMEVNGRFWGSLQLAIAAGVDFPALWLALLRGEEPSPAPSYVEGATVRWWWGDVKRILHIISGPPPDYPRDYPRIGQGLREVLGAQPRGTRSETWDRSDPWPAVGEWVQGIGELLASRASVGERERSLPPGQPLVVRPSSGAMPRVTIILPCRNEERYIGSCLASILACDYPQDRLEVLVVDGMSTDRTRERVAACVAEHPRVRLLDNPRQTAPAALNAGLRAATGDIIMRMDAHVVYPASYVRQLVAGLEETGADNVGGVIKTLPADETPVARAIAIGLSHRLGVGNSYFRVGAATRRVVNSLAFGCYRREVFDRIGLFDEELIRNQDDEFNFRLIKHGGRIVLLPEVVARYYARASLRQVARMFYQYGYFKPLVASKVGRVMTVRQLVPALFIVGLAGSALLGLWLRPAAVLFAGIAGSYAAIDIGCSAAAVRAHGARCGAALAVVFPILHFSYGAGFLVRSFEQLIHVRRPSPDAATIPLSR